MIDWSCERLRIEVIQRWWRVGEHATAMNQKETEERSQIWATVEAVCKHLKCGEMNRKRWGNLERALGTGKEPRKEKSSL